MNSLSALLEAKNKLGNDFFGGWSDADIPLLEKYADPSATHTEGFITDFIGVKTNVSFYAGLNNSNGTLIAKLPIPDDSFHADAIEYIALFNAFERSKRNSNFVAVEVGASYGPWICAAGVIAKRLGKKAISLVAVEASETKLDSISNHQRMNNLTNESGVSLKIFHGAAWNTRTTLMFPKVDVAIDNGGRVAEHATTVDYRGAHLEHVEVKTYTLEDILSGIEFVDFMHIDIQGAERNLLEDDQSLTILTNRVSTLFLGTHSRAIDGLAIERLTAAGWVLHRERPTTFNQDLDRTANVEGWTTRDGGQLWFNKKWNC
jgi:FkbM family methyltransferase